MKVPPHPLTELPFLNAALEDYSLAMRLASEGGNPRQSITLMHDALEFLIYQILSGKEVDVYKSGQNTIGFDEALQKCEKKGVSLPHIATVRDIQKRRGDAKHHGQKPDIKDFERITAMFRSLFIVMCFEHFGNHLGTSIASRTQYPYHIALHDLYRRARRDQNWERALPFAIRALIHKRRAMYGAGDNFMTHQAKKTEDLLSILESTAKQSATPEEAQKVSALVATVKHSISEEDLQSGAEAVGLAFSALDFISPTIFDIKCARKITAKLYQARSVAHTGMWSMVENRAITCVLTSNPSLVTSFGDPCFLQHDECSASTWWEFVFFDGSRWLPFHLDQGFRISSEPSEESGKGKVRPPDFAERVAEEFTNAANEDA
jgi:hypothetical protein